jgi:predicted RNase H-like nuclease (RuvC/YqgF family)
MRYVNYIAGVLIFFFSLGPVSAEFYRYVDEHGNVLFTDDLSKVPPEQRGTVQSYEATESPPLSTVKQDKEEEMTKSLTDNDMQRQKLLDQQNVLNKEYEDLMAERSRLDAEKDKAITQVEIKAYNKRIIDFNTRIKAYEEKREALNREVKTFNDRLGAQSEQKPEEKQ